MNEDKLLEEPLISVVTPVYNTELYLAECIESVLGQTYANYEYIIVNNCSTDRTLEIAQSYAKQDGRIRVVDCDVFVNHIENHNRALQLMSDKSKYCKIVQADDWMFPECLLKMTALAEAEPSIGIVSAYSIFGAEVSNRGLPFPRNIVSGREACRLHLMEGIYLFGSPTSLLFRADIVRRRVPFFSESYQPDMEACYEILQESDFGFVHEILTFMRKDNNSISFNRRRFNPVPLGVFTALHKYGDLYLDADEYARRRRGLKDRYFKFLGREYLRNRDRTFWTYHRQGLENIGYSLRKGELIKYALLFVLGCACNPNATISLAVERLKRARHDRRQIRRAIEA